MTREGEFTPATKRLIAQRAGYMCGYPNCLAVTSGPALDGSSVNVGEAAHISAASENGPRYDPHLSSEERSDAENGIWLCRTHAALIDRDVDRFTVDGLRDWKLAAEDRALKMLGQPKGCAAGRLATISPAIRVGAETSVLIDGEPVPYDTIFDPDREGSRLTWFVGAFVVQFSIQKNQNRSIVVLDHLIVTVHETKDIPQYQPLAMVYPATTSLFYAEIETNIGQGAREFRPTRFYERKDDDSTEEQRFPSPVVLDANIPAPIALRLNARDSAMYLVSIEASLSSGADRERLPVMPPQWIVFEKLADDDEDVV